MRFFFAKKQVDECNGGDISTTIGVPGCIQLPRSPSLKRQPALVRLGDSMTKCFALAGPFRRNYPSIDAEIAVDEWCGVIASIFIGGSV